MKRLQYGDRRSCEPFRFEETQIVFRRFSRLCWSGFLGRRLFWGGCK
jgi:hypothetical protein